MEDNISTNYLDISRYTATLTLESLEIPPSVSFVAFIFGTLTYCVILFFNVVLLTTIALKRNLHKPMYILLFNLPVFDLMGATAFYPQLISSILSQNRSISYPACALQAILIHLYGTGSFLILTAMAYDRYVAICWPLKYNTLMTPSMLVKLIASSWFSSFVLIGILFALTLSKEICRTKIVDTYCNNPSLVKLICSDTTVNNYYGLFIICLIQGLALFVVFLTYLKILMTCIRNKQSDSKAKAIQTCGTHLVVFVFFEFNILIGLVAHRFETVSPYLRRALFVSITVFPPILNPVIYGLKTRELREKMLTFCRRKVTST